ncbi:MAG: BatA domain-containing protein [Candidatus Hydrogenedentes bacterium]|nr:BatA domain-containing protein [Candidatus Hydrogenedentota bacterium]
MSFIQALFLLGAAGVAGPIAAHLLARPRYRRVPFTMLQFLRTGETETQSRRRLKNLLVLLLRCAIIILLALFFAGPERLLVKLDAAVSPHAFVAIDDSLSMAYGDGMARAVADAREAIRSAPADAQFDVFALASGAETRGVDRPQADAFVAALKPVPLKASVSSFFSALGAAPSGAKITAHIVSDFTPEARAAFDSIAKPAAVDHYTYTRVGPETTPANVAITAARVMPGANGNLAVSVGLANYGPAAATVTITGKIGEAPARDTSAQLGGAEKRSVQLQLPAPQGAGPYLPVEISISPEDGMPQDNHYLIGLAGSEVTAKHVVIFAADEREAFLVKTALDTLAQSNPLNVINVQALVHSRFDSNVVRNASVVIFASAPNRSVVGVDDLASFVQGGGRLIAFANKDLKPAFYESLAKAGVFPAVPGAAANATLQLEGEFGSITMGDPLSPDAAAIRALRNYGLERLPIQGAYALRTVDGGTALWRFNTGDAFVCYKASGRGSAILINTSADDALSPLMKSAAAVAFINYLIGGGAQVQQYAFDAGESVRLPASAFELAHAQPDQAFFVETPGGKQTSAQWVNQTIAIPPVNELGWVRTTATPVRYAGVNVPEGETDLTAPSSAPLDMMVQRLFATRDSVVDEGPEKGTQQRKPLWPGIGWAALALIIVDVFVSNRVTR